MSDLALHVKDKDGRCRELMLLEEMSKVAGLDILTDHSQLASVICYHEERRGSISDEKIQCRGLKNCHPLKFLLTLHINRLRIISFVDCGINDENITHLLEALDASNYRGLEHLDFSRNEIGSSGALALSKFIRVRGLKHLNLSKNRLGDVWSSRGITMGSINTDGLCTLLSTIIDCHRCHNSDDFLKLEHLDISRNMIGQDSDLVSVLCELIEIDFDNLRLVNLTGNCFDVTEMTRMMTSAQSNCHIESYTQSSYERSPDTVQNSKVNLAGTNLTPLDFMFLDFTGNCKTVQRSIGADFSWNPELGTGDLSIPLSSYPFRNLQTLKLVQISMDEEFAEILRSVMESPQCCLTSMDVAGNSATLGTKGFNHLLLGLGANSSLLYMSLMSCVPRKYRTYCRIGAALEQNHTLQELDISQSYRCNFDPRPLFRSLLVNSTLQTLRLSRCEISSSGITPLSEVMECNKSLTCLDLTHNFICRYGWNLDFNVVPALSLTVALRHLNTDVEELSPLASEWSPISYYAQLETKQAFSPLRELNLSHNKIEGSVVEGIAEALKNKRLHIDTLDVSCCGIGVISGKLFGDVLAQVTHLKTLLMRCNDMGVEGIESVLYGIADNASITRVDVSGNNKPQLQATTQIIRDHNEGSILIALRSCLTKNKIIQHVNLRSNQLFGADSAANLYRDTSMNELAEAIKCNADAKGNLQTLNILDNSFHNCGKCRIVAKKAYYLSPTMFAAHVKSCQACPAVWMNNAVQSMRDHPTLTTLFGIDSDAKSLRVDVGRSIDSPVLWALFEEIVRHQLLERLDLSTLRCRESEMAKLSEFLHGNSLLKTVKLSQFSPHEEQEAMWLNKEVSFDCRIGIAVFMRGYTHLGSEALRNVAEYIYGVGLQSSKFLKYRVKANYRAGAGRMKLT